MGMSIGGHTHRHPILSRLPEDEARHEIEHNRDLLADWLGEPPRVFAYPNGVPSIDYGQRDRRLVRDAGYEAAVTTGHGVARLGDDEFQLPRFTSWRRGMVQFALHTLRNCASGSAPMASASAS
jgi:peptidoglycan/xylan/chitin deacetylase (PgdA/CDA1 family)